MKLKCKYSFGVIVYFLDLKPFECGRLRMGKQIKLRKPILGCVLGVTFSQGNTPMYTIQDFDGYVYETVSEEHVIGLASEDELS